MNLLQNALLMLLILLVQSDKGVGIRITDLQVETPMISGGNGCLKCEWDSEGDTLYSVKWYWGTKEFYRWSPKADNPILVFNVSAFIVDPVRSSRGNVFIRNISLRASGVLRCEVSGEGPIFHTDHSEVHLKVIYLPDKRPIITGKRSSPYELHQSVSLICTSAESRPAATLAFYINDQKVDNSWLLPQKPKLDRRTYLETAALGIRFPLQPRLIRNGKVVVKCTAQIYQLYWESTFKNIYLAGEVPQRASRKEERSSSAANINFTMSLKGYGNCATGFVIYLLVYFLN